MHVRPLADPARNRSLHIDKDAIGKLWPQRLGDAIFLVGFEQPRFAVLERWRIARC